MGMTCTLSQSCAQACQGLRIAVHSHQRWLRCPHSQRDSASTSTNGGHATRSGNYKDQALERDESRRVFYMKRSHHFSQIKQILLLQLMQLLQFLLENPKKLTF